MTDGRMCSEFEATHEWNAPETCSRETKPRLFSHIADSGHGRSKADLDTVSRHFLHV
jgi:hypothetical protein